MSPRPARDNDAGALAIGSRVLVTSTKTGERDVELSDQDGMPVGLRMRVDEVTTVTAWRPRRGAAPRYRVRSADGLEGWIDAANLRRPPAPPPAPVAIPEPPSRPRPAAKVPAPKTRPQPPARGRKTARPQAKRRRS